MKSSLLGKNNTKVKISFFIRNIIKNNVKHSLGNAYYVMSFT